MTRGETLTTDADENQAIAWFDVLDPPTIGWELHKLFVQRLQRRQRGEAKDLKRNY